MPTLIDFYADWCGPCKQMNPILEELDEERDEVDIRKVDVDDEQDVANEYDVRSLPTIVILDDDDTPVERFVGVTQKDELAAALDDAA